MKNQEFGDHKNCTSRLGMVNYPGISHVMKENPLNSELESVEPIGEAETT